MLIRFILFLLCFGLNAKNLILADSDSPFYKRIISGIVVETVTDFSEFDIIYLSREEKKVIPENYKTIFVLGVKSLEYLGEDGEIGKKTIALLPASSRSNNKITALYLEMTEQQELQGIKAIYPNIKKLGVIFHPKKSQNLLNLLKMRTNRLGFQLVGIPVFDPEEVRSALERHGNQLDALWVMTDPVALNNKSIRQLIDFAEEKKLLAFGYGEAFVAAGGTFSFSINAEYTGRLLARLKKNRAMKIKPEFRLNINLSSLNASDASRRALNLYRNAMVQAQKKNYLLKIY